MNSVSLIKAARENAVMITAQGGEPDDAVFEMDLDLGPHHLWHAATFDTLAPSGKRDVERLQAWLDEHLKGLDPNAAPADLVKEVRFFFFPSYLSSNIPLLSSY